MAVEDSGTDDATAEVGANSGVVVGEAGLSWDETEGLSVVVGDAEVVVVLTVALTAVEGEVV